MSGLRLTLGMVEICPLASLSNVRLNGRPVRWMVLETNTLRTARMSPLFSRKEETQEGQAVPGPARAEERHPAHE